MVYVGQLIMILSRVEFYYCQVKRTNEYVSDVMRVFLST